METAKALDPKAYVPVLDSRGDRIECLFMRGEKYYVKVQRQGKRYIRSLPAETKDAARAMARQFARSVRMGIWEEVEAVRTKRDAAPASISEIMAAYRVGATRRGRPRLYVIECNCRALLRVASSQSVRTEALTPDLLDRFAVKQQEGTEPGTPARDARDRSIASLIRTAKSCFAEREDFRALKLPPKLDEFMRYSPVRPKLPLNLQPPLDVATATAYAGRALIGDRGAIFSLCYDLGMRCGEIVGARWGWMENNGDGMFFMVIRDRPEEGYTVKSSACRVTRERRIPIPAKVFATLGAPGPAGQHILMPEASDAARRSAVTRDFCAWLRGVNTWWLQKRKGAHALRGLRGAYWINKYGHVWTMQWLGHVDFQVTLDHYARALEYEEPQALDDDAWLLARRLRAV